MKIPSALGSTSVMAPCDESAVATRLRRVLMFLVCPTRITDPVILSAQGNTFRLDRFMDADNPILPKTLYKIEDGKYVSPLERINWLLYFAPTLLNRLNLLLAKRCELQGSLKILCRRYQSLTTSEISNVL